MLNQYDTFNDDLQVVLIEDDDGDAKAIQRAFKKAGVKSPITRAIDGIDALKKLRGEEGHPKISRPMILLIDLNMPRMGGLELIETIRVDDDLQDNIIFVLSTSNAPEDRKTSYGFNVAGYIQKGRIAPNPSLLTKMLHDYVSIVDMPQ